MFFFRVRAKKARLIDSSSVVWTLIYNGKLAKQIARLAAIVVKNYFVRGVHDAPARCVSSWEVIFAQACTLAPTTTRSDQCLFGREKVIYYILGTRLTGEYKPNCLSCLKQIAH